MMKGDIVRVRRKRVGILESLPHKNEHMTVIDEVIARTKSYYHYGIQISEDKVVHFVGASYLKRKESKIEITSISKFLRDGKLEIVDSYSKSFSNEEIVNRALSKVGTNFDGYSVIKNNCEHFATWCATGKKQSQQSNILEQSRFLISLPLRPLNKIEEKILIRL